MDYSVKLISLIYIYILFGTQTIGATKPELIKVAESDYQWTGIALSREGRIFVNYPTWKVESPFKVAEIVNGREMPYPSAVDNEQFVCVQSVVIDDMNRLWILDPANPDFKGVVKEGPSLYKVDLITNKIIKTYKFSPESYSQKSYLNDVRIDTKKNVAYITDSTIGGILVIDLTTGKSWRAIDSSCKAVLANLDGIEFRSTGKSTGITHSDGLELSVDRNMLYFAALTANVLYAVPTETLLNQNITVGERCSKVKTISENNVPTDGMVLHNNKLYMANLPEETVWEFDLALNKGRNLNFGKTIRWADSFAQDTDGYVYFTTSQINYPVGQRVKYEIYKFKL